MTTRVPPRRSAVTLATWLVAVGTLTLSAQADWPTYQHDAARSGSTSERAPENPIELWAYQAPTRPVPAWDEPALWDGWSKTHDLRNRQVFDKAFHVAVVGDRMFFGSSIDDQVRCLSTKTGEAIWSFFTEGPVRLAPTVVNERVYVGSDDGFVYCLGASSGELIWKKRLGPNDRRLAGNGRVISPWAVRTSVVVVGETAYCGAGVIPSEGVFVLALNTNSGEELWRTEMTDLPAQGYMLASESRLYVVTSRDTPIVLDAKSGKRLHKVQGGTGGTYALLTGDTLLFGPGKTGDVNMVGGEKSELLASFQGNHMIVSQPLSYLQSNDELSSLDRGAYVQLYAQRKKVDANKSETEKRLKKARDAKDAEETAKLQQEVDTLNAEVQRLTEAMKSCLKWRTECSCPYALILANGVLVGGGDGEVVAVSAESGQRLWQRKVPGKVYGLAVSDGQLFVSTDSGTIHCFGDGQQTEPAPPKLAKKKRPVRRQIYPGPIASSEKLVPEIHGPFTEFVAPGKVQITWDTDLPTTSTLSFGVDMTSARKWTDDAMKTEHTFVVDDVQREVVYRFQVGGNTQDGDELVTDAYRFDSHLYYLPPISPPRPSPYAESTRTDAYRALAKQMIDTAQAERGYALVLGADDGQLAYELAQASQLNIVVVDPDAEKIEQIRRRMEKCGLYGIRIVAFQRGLDELQLGPFLANLIVSESALTTGRLPAETSSYYSALRPAGGTVVLGSLRESDDTNTPRETDAPNTELRWRAMDTELGTFWVHQRDKLPQTGEWTHQYASADNSACSQDEQIRGEMMVQWWGRPGARPMPDRGARNPPPVSANGRLYVQGNRTLFGLDAYNGAILWAKQIPTMRRANMPRDASNMVASDEHVTIAMGDRCVAFDGRTGQRIRDFTVPEFSPLHEYDWGYVSRIDSQLFGSAVRRGSQYLGDKGEWYEKFGEEHVAKVTSDSVFSLDAYSGELQWLRSEGVVINSTITIADATMYFIESRSTAAREADKGRLLNEVMEDQFLVAVEAGTGKQLWEQRFDFSKCKSVTYMTHANSTLLVTGTDDKGVFHTYAFDGQSGSPLWQHEAADKKGHHTGQLAHPTIVGNRVYFNKHTYELRTGEVLGTHDFNWHGCGVMSASNHSVFSRYEYHGMLDLATNERTEFLGIRSGCWLSLIPSGGLLLAPETSAGCSCGHSIQTSIAYVPKALANKSQIPPISAEQSK